MIVPLLVRFLTENLLASADVTKGFIDFAAATDAEAWLRFAAKHSLPPDDTRLALVAARELQLLLLEALSLKLDRLQAVTETNELLGLGP